MAEPPVTEPIRPSPDRPQSAAAVRGARSRFRASRALRRARVLPNGVERPVDVAYELWDHSLYFAAIATVAYVINPPTDASQNALSAVFDFAAPWQWGASTALILIIGVVCSYRERWLGLGYYLLIVVATAWAGWFAVGIFAYDAPARSWTSVIIYGAIASRSYRLRARL